MFYIYQLTKFSQPPCEGGLTPLIQIEAKFKDLLRVKTRLWNFFRKAHCQASLTLKTVVFLLYPDLENSLDFLHILITLTVRTKVEGGFRFHRKLGWEGSLLSQVVEPQGWGIKGRWLTFDDYSELFPPTWWVICNFVLWWLLTTMIKY